MKILIDVDEQRLTVSEQGTQVDHLLYSPEAFAILSRQWMHVAWSLKYYHTFRWLGVPILQLPKDLFRLQEVIFRLKPDLIIETGVFCGGSLLFAASLCQSIGRGGVVGVELLIRDDARKSIADSRLSSRISLIEGDSASPDVLTQVKSRIKPGDRVMVILDSDHSAQHVTRELEAYSPFITSGSCLLVEDAVMRHLVDVPGGDPSWILDSPGPAIEGFLATHPEFRREPPVLQVDESPIRESSPTFWPDGWLWKD